MAIKLLHSFHSFDLVVFQNPSAPSTTRPRPGPRSIPGSIPSSSSTFWRSIDTRTVSTAWLRSNSTRLYQSAAPSSWIRRRLAIHRSERPAVCPRTPGGRRLWCYASYPFQYYAFKREEKWRLLHVSVSNGCRSGAASYRADGASAAMSYLQRVRTDAICGLPSKPPCHTRQTHCHYTLSKMQEAHQEPAQLEKAQLYTDSNVHCR